MKTIKRIMTMILTAGVLFSLAACGGSAKQNTATYDYEKGGEILFTYSKDDFTYNEKWSTLENKDGSVTIRFNADYQENQRQAALANFDCYVATEGGTCTELTVGKYNAYRYEYLDSDFGDYTVATYISFGDSPKHYYGIMVTVTSGKSFDECKSDAIEAIIQSIEVK